MCPASAVSYTHLDVYKRQDNGHSCYIGRWLSLVMLSVVFRKDKGLV